MKLRSKVAIITGSSKGIGKATAILFAREGAKVVVSYVRDRKSADKVVNLIRARNGIAISVKADVSNPKDVKRLFRQTVKAFGTVDILVNNAGIAPAKEFLKLTPEDVRHMIDVNVISMILCAQEAAKIMLRKKSGKIINISSIRGLEHSGRPYGIAYGISKAGVINFTGSLAKRLAPYINVNAVAPGVVSTPRILRMDAKTKKEFMDATYLKRWIKPEEIASACLFLASEDSNAMTGHTLVIDAGFQLK